VLKYEATVSNTGCMVLTGVLHYSVACALFWVVCDAHATQKIFSAVVAGNGFDDCLRGYFVFGYGLPLVFAIAGGVISNSRDDDNNSVCSSSSLSSESIWHFIYPLIGVAIVSMMGLTVVLVSMVYTIKSARNKLLLDQGQGQHALAKQRMTSRMKATVSLLLLMFVTWISGTAIVVSPQHKGWEFAFATLCILQSLFVLTMNCFISSAQPERQFGSKTATTFMPKIVHKPREVAINSLWIGGGSFPIGETMDYNEDESYNLTAMPLHQHAQTHPRSVRSPATVEETTSTVPTSSTVPSFNSKLPQITTPTRRRKFNK